MSPEVFASRGAFDGCAVDMWAAGTILFCMLSGTQSYGAPHEDDVQYHWMVHGLRELLSEWEIQLTEEALHLLENLLQPHPRRRLTLDEVMNHPWMSGPERGPSIYV